jgi:transcriptional regulator with XRE-family HTH domain
MTTLLTHPHEIKPGSEAHRLRLSLNLSRSQLAVMAGVSIETVDLYERNQPVALDARRRIHKELWAQKSKK